MSSQIYACIYKFLCETKNNIKKTISSVVINVLLMLFIFLKTKNSDLIGLDYKSLIVVYCIVWSVMMAFTLVNDIIVAINDEGITEQIYLSSCSISRYVSIQIFLKGLYSMFFISFVLTVCNMLIGDVSFRLIVSMLCTLVIGIISILGLGYLISSISIIVNNRNISMLLRVVLLYVIIKSEKSPYIPFATCKVFLADLIMNNRFIWEQRNTEIIYFFINSLVFYLLGIVVFKMMTIKKLYIQNDF